MAGRIAYYGNIATQGLVLNLDAAIQGSYPKTGSTWFDISNNGNNGTLTNGPLYIGSDYGAIVFDGVNDYVEVPNNVALNSNIGTISIWFNSTTVSGRSAVLIGKTDSVGSFNGINILTSGTEIYGQVKGSSDQIISGSLLSQNTWYNFTLTYSSGISYSSYLNGSLIGTNTLTSFTFSTQPLRIARSLDSFWTIYKGQVSNAMIYNRALSAQEITQNFNTLRGRYGI